MKSNKTPEKKNIYAKQYTRAILHLDGDPGPIEAQNVAGAVGLEVVHFHAFPAPRAHRLYVWEALSSPSHTQPPEACKKKAIKPLIIKV